MLHQTKMSVEPYAMPVIWCKKLALRKAILGRDCMKASLRTSTLNRATIGCRTTLSDNEMVMAPRAGLEPATLRLTAGCSTIELPRNQSI